MSLMTLGQKNPTDSLRIFDNFRIDKNLPKFQKAKESKAVTLVGDGVTFSTNTDSNIMVGGATSFVVHHDNASFSIEPQMNWLGRFWRWMTGRSPKSIKYVFNAVLNNDEELAIFDERNTAAQKVIEQAEKMGQKSLVRELKETIELSKFENALVAKGMTRFISESQLLFFVQNCKRGLCLDWVSDFTRPIPDDVAETKLKCDEAHLFDNYVVLHYDPQIRGTSRVDREAAKDPILFGVIRGSRKLYFVGDWIDEYCDLTLQQLVANLPTGERTHLDA